MPDLPSPRRTIAIDLDGVLASTGRWRGVAHVGEPISGAIDFVRSIYSFARVVIHTARCAELGVFTIWDAAPVYEAGDTISSASGGWLLVALDKAAYTAGGRIKRSWRDAATGKFAKDKLEGLAAVPVKGGYLLYEQQEQGMAMKPRFLLIRQTKRTPLLRFMADFFVFVAQSGGLDNALDRALEAAEKNLAG